MTVKNEADTIEACLAPIVDLLAQVVIIDTGSTDGTQEILRQRFGIVAQQAEMSFDNCHALATHRNRGFEQLQTPWTLSLDADERIDRDAFRDLLEMNDDALPHGLFCAWITHCGNGRWIEDYKLSLFRRGFTKQGLVHDTVQPSFRQQSGHAIWTDRIAIQHYPAPDRVEDKLDYYTRRLECACQQEPDWLRYQWFVGYTLFTRQRYDEARTALVELHKLRPVLFLLSHSMHRWYSLRFTRDMESSKRSGRRLKTPWITTLRLPMILRLKSIFAYTHGSNRHCSMLKQPCWMRFSHTLFHMEFIRNLRC